MMDKIFTNFIQTNVVLKLESYNFSNKVIFEEVLQDHEGYKHYLLVVKLKEKIFLVIKLFEL